MKGLTLARSTSQTRLPCCLSAPKVLEPVGRQLGVAHRVLDVLVAKPCLQRPRIVPGIGQGVATGVPQQFREYGEGHTGAPTEALEQRAEALGRHWATALTGEHVWRCLLLTLQAPQGANFVALHWMHRGGALFAPTDVQPAGVDLDLVPLQIAQLGSSKPVAIGQQDHGRVAMPVTTALARGLHELLDLAACEVAPGADNFILGSVFLRSV